MKNDPSQPLASLAPYTSDASSGHTLNLRKRMKAAREDRGLSQEDVALRIAKRLGKGRHDKSNIGKYEQNKRQPPIDVMAAWARAVGFKLHVDLAPQDGERVFTLLSKDMAHLAREIDSAEPEVRALILATAHRMLGIS